MGGTWVKQYQDTEEGRWKSKKKGSASTLRAVPSNFTAVVAPIITLYYAIMAARHKHAHTSTGKTQKDLKKTVINKVINRVNRETRRAAAGRRSGQ